MKRSRPSTEETLPDVAGLDTWEDSAILGTIAMGQRRALASVELAAPKIAEAANVVAQRLQAGGRIIYAGAGTSIRLAVQDGAELPETFGLDPGRIAYLIAGGTAALMSTSGNDEDDRASAAHDAAICGASDVMIAVAASGSTPYTLVAAETASKAGTHVIAIVNNAGTPLGKLAGTEIVLDSGPEVIAGSTRMGAGTAQKAALNMLSTLANIKLGAVYDGLMVNVKAGNDKLRRRAQSIVMQIAGVDKARAADALINAYGEIKPAALLCAGAKDLEAAHRLLAASKGNLREALKQLKSP